MTKLLVDVNSIAEAAANGLPFCGTEEINERAGAVFHLISTVVTEYSPDFEYNYGFLYIPRNR